MLTDFILASLHHVLVFSLMAVLAMEFMLVKPGISGPAIKRLAVIDGLFGALAVLVIMAGVCRVIWGLKGWEAYVHNVWFWHKMGTFVLVGLLSIMPTLRFLKWRKAAAADPSFVAPDADVRTVRKFLHAELALFLLIPIFAAAMARYGA
jgi:putative membrane protein